ncbi:uncharacterized protein LOC132984078 [Labrus mixtus]|uniref:uncharacterized protein LOC132984078 n=1 Tax=Labrus mixtus TaxID=508554 RepID=UPI0029C0C9A6|nr:uncharacterized protein LOC132984078 [Labrus mixtus]
MKMFMCIFLPFATMVAAVPIRVQKENVLSFLNGALDPATAKPISATITAEKNPLGKPVKEQDSAVSDMSDAKSREGFYTNGHTDVFKHLDSHEVMNSRRKTGSISKDNSGPVDVSSRPVQDQGSREHIGPVAAQQASRGQVDHNSQEVLTADPSNAYNLSGKQVHRLRRGQVTDRASVGKHLQRKAAPRGVHGLNGMLRPGMSREVLDLDSLEENNGRPAPIGNRGPPIDYDETREFISSETNPIAPPKNIPSGSSVLAKRRAS